MVNIIKNTFLLLSLYLIRIMNKINNNSSYILLFINICVIILVSSNLRSPLTAVGPVLHQLEAALNLTHFQSSLLISIPLFMFATCSVLVSSFSNKLSINNLLLYALIFLNIGLFLRVLGPRWSLFIGSIFIGLGICIGNVIVPGYIKNNFSSQIGIMTGVFAISMNIIAALASGYSVKIGEWTGLNWQGSLGIWIVFSLLALIFVCIDLFFNKINIKEKPIIEKDDFNIFKSSQAWYISIFMGLQSLVYYCMISWLPIILVDYGMMVKDTGWILFVIQMAMLPVTFISPIIANRMSNQKSIITFVCVLLLISISLLTWTKLSYIFFAAILLGLSNGMSFSLSILFFSLKTKKSINAIKISGMAQSIGYLIAAIGPPLFGILHFEGDSWNTSFYFIFIVILLMFYFGKKAAANSYIDSKNVI